MIKIIILLAVVIHCIINPSLIGIYCIFGFFGGAMYFFVWLATNSVVDTIRIYKA